MTVTASTYQTVSLPEGTPLAAVNAQSGDLTLWPAGVGVGPTITMSIADWHQLRASADSAIMVGERSRWEDYSACEGNGYDE